MGKRVTEKNGCVPITRIESATADHTDKALGVIVELLRWNSHHRTSCDWSTVQEYLAV